MSTYKKKSTQTQSPKKSQSSQSLGGSGDTSKIDEAPLPVVPVEVEQHTQAEPDATSIVGRAKAKLAEMGQGEAEAMGEPAKPKSDWRRYSTKERMKRKAEADKQELATLTSTLLILGVAMWSAPETVKPSGTEVDAFSDHLSNVILRHIDISNALTGDVIDLIGMLAVIGSWLTRVGPALREYNEQNKSELPPGSPKPPKPKLPPSDGKGEVAAEHSVTPIEHLSPATKQYLDNLANEPAPDLGS